MPLERGLEQEDCLAALHPAGMAHQNAGQPIGADNIHLASLHREQDIVRSAIAADELELCSGIGVERGRKQNRGGAAAGGADGVRLRANALEGLDAAPPPPHPPLPVPHPPAPPPPPPPPPPPTP